MSFLDNAREDIEARRSSGGGQGGGLYLRIGKGESEVIRFLDEGDEITTKNVAWFHKTPPTEGRPYGSYVPCRDQDEQGNRIGEPCPGCERNSENREICKRQVRGFVNVIWRNAPVFQRDDEGKLVRDSSNKPIVESRKDQLAIWECGISVIEDLSGLDVSVKGLGSRDFKVDRQGEKYQTKYTVLPVDFDGGPTPLSEEDKELAANKHNFEDRVAPPSYEDWGKRKKSSEQSEASGVSSDSPFLKRSN